MVTAVTCDRLNLEFMLKTRSGQDKTDLSDDIKRTLITLIHTNIFQSPSTITDGAGHRDKERFSGT